MAIGLAVLVWVIADTQEPDTNAKSETITKTDNAAAQNLFTRRNLTSCRASHAQTYAGTEGWATPSHGPWWLPAARASLHGQASQFSTYGSSTQYLAWPQATRLGKPPQALEVAQPDLARPADRCRNWWREVCVKSLRRSFTAAPSGRGANRDLCTATGCAGRPDNQQGRYLSGPSPMIHAFGGASLRRWLNR